MNKMARKKLDANDLRKMLMDERGTITIECALRRAKKKWGKK